MSPYTLCIFVVSLVFCVLLLQNPEHEDNHKKCAQNVGVRYSFQFFCAANRIRGVFFFVQLYFQPQKCTPIDFFFALTFSEHHLCMLYTFMLFSCLETYTDRGQEKERAHIYDTTNVLCVLIWMCVCYWAISYWKRYTALGSLPLYCFIWVLSMQHMCCLLSFRT